ncbi:MAG: sialidase family protein, partial [Acidobacteriaceae bacterium]
MGKFPFALVLPVLSFAIPAFGQQLPPAPGAQVTTISPQPGTWTEPAVAVNPLNPQQVVTVFQYTAHASYSDDAGRTWHLAEGVTPPEYRMSGDVSVTFDSQGHAILGCIAFDKLGTFNY